MDYIHLIKKGFLIGLLVSLFMVCSTNPIERPTFHISKEKDSPIGKITIPKIELEEYFYQQDSQENTIEKHVSILGESILPNEENSILILAAHSGTGPIAYFERLDELTIGDSITINYQGIDYIYQVKEIWEEEKNGYIHLKKELENQLILTTCSPSKNNKQLIINCIKKEST